MKESVGRGRSGLLSGGAGEGLAGSKLRDTGAQCCPVWFIVTQLSLALPLTRQEPSGSGCSTSKTRELCDPLPGGQDAGGSAKIQAHLHFQ